MDELQRMSTFGPDPVFDAKQEPHVAALVELRQELIAMVVEFEMAVAKVDADAGLSPEGRLKKRATLAAKPLARLAEIEARVRVLAGKSAGLLAAKAALPADIDEGRAREIRAHVLPPGADATTVQIALTTAVENGDWECVDALRRAPRVAQVLSEEVIAEAERAWRQRVNPATVDASDNISRTAQRVGDNIVDFRRKIAALTGVTDDAV